MITNNIMSNSKDNLPAALRSSYLEENKKIVHGFFTRQGGVSTGIYQSLNVGTGSNDDPASITENRRLVCAALGFPLERLQTVHQIHSSKVVTVTEPLPSVRPQADALVTNVPGFILGALSADCGPVLFAEPDAGIIGAAHAGWKGALSGILENTIEAMITLGAERSRITAVLGPTIGPLNYEVGAEFVAEFTNRDIDNIRYFSDSHNPACKMFDLWRFINDRLSAAGINASTLNVCTYEHEAQFFSYRRTTHRKEADYGRQIAAIAIQE